MEENEFGEQKPISKYNAAVSQIYRLDALWQSAHMNSRGGNFYKWNFDLDAIWRELSGDADINDQKKYFKFMHWFVKYRKNGRLYLVLTLKETFLRELQNKQGKGTAYIDPDEDSLED